MFNNGNMNHIVLKVPSSNRLTYDAAVCILLRPGYCSAGV